MDGQIAVAWCGGFFDGEGCISTMERSGGRENRSSLSASSTDLDMLERFMAVVGCGHIYNKTYRGAPDHWKQAWLWKCDRHTDVEYAIRLLLPYLCKRRTLAAVEALVSIEANRRNRMRECLGCGEQFESPRNRGKWCSIECKSLYKSNEKREAYRAERLHELTCPRCGVSFAATRANRRYCSSFCQERRLSPPSLSLTA